MAYEVKVVELAGGENNRLAGLVEGRYHRMFNDLEEAKAFGTQTKRDVLAISEIKVYFVQVDE